MLFATGGVIGPDGAGNYGAHLSAENTTGALFGPGTTDEPEDRSAMGDISADARPGTVRHLCSKSKRRDAKRRQRWQSGAIGERKCRLVRQQRLDGPTNEYCRAPSSA